MQNILTWVSAHLTLWTLIGFFGQSMFMMRFIVQWIASERAKQKRDAGNFLVFQPRRRPDRFRLCHSSARPCLYAGARTGVVCLSTQHLLHPQTQAGSRCLKNWPSFRHSFFAPDGKKLSLLAYLFLVMLCVGFFTPGLATMPPTDRDEASFVQASKQMIESGNYTDIRLQDEPRYKKPIGIYWLQSAVVRVFNPHHLDEIWAYRIPSFVGATVAVLMTAALGSLLFNPLTGLLAAMMLAGCILMNVEARIATTDAALLASIMVAMYGLARAYLGQISGWRVPLVFWTAFAVGILLKGPIILLPILGALVVAENQR